MTPTLQFIVRAQAEVPRLAAHDWLATQPPAAGVDLLLPNDFDIASLPDDLSGVRSIALQFPKWTDGRAYSQARLLRVRKRFKGEIRATGEVLADMAPLLARTGFDVAELRADQKVEVAQRALDFFPMGHYQGDVSEPRPLFARSAA